MNIWLEPKEGNWYDVVIDAAPAFQTYNIALAFDHFTDVLGYIDELQPMGPILNHAGSQSAYMFGPTGFKIVDGVKVFAAPTLSGVTKICRIRDDVLPKLDLSPKATAIFRAGLWSAEGLVPLTVIQPPVAVPPEHNCPVGAIRQMLSVEDVTGAIAICDAYLSSYA